MLLKDIELPNEEMKMAMEDGITTIEDYNSWYMGYISGYRQRQKEVIAELEKL